jgi:hypothetical protein
MIDADHKQRLVSFFSQGDDDGPTLLPRLKHTYERWPPSFASARSNLCMTDATTHTRTPSIAFAFSSADIFATTNLHPKNSHPGSFTIINIKDATGNVFATREENIFVIGEAGDDFTAKVTLPKAKGIKLSILEERKKMFKDL